MEVDVTEEERSVEYGDYAGYGGGEGRRVRQREVRLPDSGRGAESDNAH